MGVCSYCNKRVPYDDECFSWYRAKVSCGIDPPEIDPPTHQSNPEIWLSPYQGDNADRDSAIWARGTRVRKKSGASWQGRVVGYYTTSLTPLGYCVESEREQGSVQIYPAAALELVRDGE